MKVLLTGAGGFLGSRVAERLLAAGVTRLRLQYRQLPSPARIEALRTQYPQADIQVVTANLLTRNSLDAVVADIDCVVHAAAGMRGAAADMFLNTVLATRNLLDAIAAAGVRRVVLISSFSVYRSVELRHGDTLTESLATEPVGIDKGPYGYAKTRQEQLFLEYRDRHGFESAILRPGVIYGPGGGALSPRVGIGAMGVFFSLGGRALLPLTYVDNCADAVARVALHAPSGFVCNVVDDDLPTCAAYLRAYRNKVKPMRVLRLPYWALLLASRALVSYNRRSKGQLPAVFTPYVVRSMFRRLRYDNSALKSVGWHQRVPTNEGLRLTFEYLKANT
jgi:nucleoside-diphosphate-sugar epimerase